MVEVCVNIEMALVVANIALVIAAAIHILIMWRLTLQTNKRLRISTLINMVCSQIATRVQKRSQAETDVTNLRLEEIRLGFKGIVTLEKKKLKYREEQCKDTITETQNEINNLRKKLKRLEGELENG